jgi:formylglycine-generating enzyme required for sulfatase activity
MAGRLYPWGDQWDESHLNYGYFIRGLINFVFSFATGTTPVNQYSPGGDSPYGAADMSGNVWEWCADWYDKTTCQYRAREPVKDPRGPEKGTGRVMRGGSWYLDRSFARCAARFGTAPKNRWNDLGFRVALTG